MELFEENNVIQEYFGQDFGATAVANTYYLWFLMEELFNVPKKKNKQLRERPVGK